MKRAWIVLVLLLACPVLAQESASYELTEYAFNAGGVPTGEVPSSASYQITLASTGQSTAEVTLAEEKAEHVLLDKLDGAGVGGAQLILVDDHDPPLAQIECDLVQVPEQRFGAREIAGGGFLLVAVALYLGRGAIIG